MTHRASDNSIHNTTGRDTTQPNTPAERHKAARTAAHTAYNADELAEVLDMLGLTAQEGKHTP